jgi:cysteine-rich repeat protein
MASRAEVTVEQYGACVIDGACSEPLVGKYCNWNKPNTEKYPVNCVSWEQATQYAKWVDTQIPAMHVRLPTEAEWEYIARSQGQTNKYPWGDDLATCEFANMNDGTGYGCGTGFTAPVCSTSTTNTPRQAPLANGDSTEGICDMAGSLSEWTLDRYSSNYAQSHLDARPFLGSTNPDIVGRLAPSDLKVTRGGSFVSSELFVRSTFRSASNRHSQRADIGIRLVSSLCGNGVLDFGEECDDGNHDAFDDCNFLCQNGDF